MTEPVTAEKSKGQQKRDQKAAETAAKKAAKLAEGKAIVEEFRSDRLRQIDGLGYPNAYPHKWPVDILLPAFRARFDGLEYGAEGGFEAGVTNVIAGRALTVRQSGKDLAFVDLYADDAKIQVMLNSANWKGAAGFGFDPAAAGAIPESFDDFVASIKRGDIVGFVGHPGRSKTGELSLYASSGRLLSYCCHMLPKANTLTDEETRKRQRYLDMIVNPGVRRGFYVRNLIIKHIRENLDALGFTEVETPILNAIPGGAAARPFATHHNELDMPMFMRIAPELYLKMLVIGGMDRVYEIGRQFRNEGIDATHNPEFTSLEFYWAYVDYNDLMGWTEAMLEALVRRRNLDPRIIKPLTDAEKAARPEAREVWGSTLIEHKGRYIDFKAPYPRISLMKEIEKNIGAIPRPYTSPEAEAFLDAACKRLKLDFPAPWTTTRMIDRLAEQFVEVQCEQPTFVIDHPVVMTPLAKWNRTDPELTERFELFVGKKELVNAYTELNCPQVQRERFTLQAADRERGDDETPPVDEGFCTALEYALPPTGGLGLGVDRLAMFLSGAEKIAEVILFPTCRPEDGLGDAGAAAGGAAGGAGGAGGGAGRPTAAAGAAGATAGAAGAATKAAPQAKAAQPKAAAKAEGESKAAGKAEGESKAAVGEKGAEVKATEAKTEAA